MAITVTRTPIVGTLFQSVTICFSGRHYWPIAGLTMLGGFAAGVLIGAIVGMVVIQIVPDPEPLSRAALTAFAARTGAIIGAILGVLITAAAVLGGRCNCPSGLKAACITLLVIQGYLPVGVASNPGACTTVTGC